MIVMFKMDENGIKAMVDNKNINHVLEQMRAALNKAVWTGPMFIEAVREKKTRTQEQKYHAMINDIAESVYLTGKQYSADVWKAKLVDDFEAEYESTMGHGLKHGGQWTMNITNQYPIRIRPTTTKFLKPEACMFVTYLYKKGAEFGAVFSDDSMSYYEEAIEYVKSKRNP